MKKPLNIDSWPRKDHFNFFKEFDEPFFGVCVDIDCTESYAICKSEGISFFLYYLHKALTAANETEPFRFRIENDEVFIYSKVHASPTINRPDGTFGFAYIDYDKDFQTFYAGAEVEIERVQNSHGLVPAVSGENVIHFSSLPWINFTSLSHARNFSFNDSSPKISFGKIIKDGNAKKMPVSIHVHHALMDGYHVSQYIDMFQELLN